MLFTAKYWDDSVQANKQQEDSLLLIFRARSSNRGLSRYPMRVGTGNGIGHATFAAEETTALIEAKLYA